MTVLKYAPRSEFERALASHSPKRTELFAALCRLNVLYMVKRAGSGHLGTSFSCQDIVAWFFLNRLTLPDDICFSSKGHDVPAFYAVLTGLGIMDFELIHKLRRLGGLPGHPEARHPHMEANTGSLGMGISKAKGFILARRLQKRPGRVVVITGDGELEEGQIWESLASAVTRKMGELTVVVDHNKIQSDTWCRRVSDLGDPVARFSAFGWAATRCDGHDMASLAAAVERLDGETDRPKVIVADTIKGRGVSIMEQFGAEEKFYQFHSGAPDDEAYRRGLEELEQTVRALDGDLRLETHETVVTHSDQPRHKLVEAYSRALVAQAERNPKLVVLDADLVKDCGLAAFADRFPERFIECGIAEQDMVAMAGGLALKGMLPVANSFSCFLSSRPNEQIYTNATEESKVLYVGTLAGLLPGTPGLSHQAVRDIASLSATPGLTMIAPATEPETEDAVDFCLNRTKESCYLRLSSIPCILPFAADPKPRLKVGRGSIVRPGDRAVVFAYGPVMLAQVWEAAQKLGPGLKVINLPWLNRVDPAWLADVVRGVRWLFTVDDHYVESGQGDLILSRLAEHGWPAGLRARKFGVTGLPACGQNPELLKHHRLDADGLAAEFSRILGPP